MLCRLHFNPVNIPSLVMSDEAVILRVMGTHMITTITTTAA